MNRDKMLLAIGALMVAAALVLMAAGWWMGAPAPAATPDGAGRGSVGSWPGGMMGSWHGGMMGRHMGGWGGGGDRLPDPPPAGAPRVAAALVLDEWSMTPGRLTAREGEVLVLTIQNRGSVVHGLAIPGLDLGINAISPGESRTVELALFQAGEYEVYCPIPGHAQLGQWGSLVVSNP